MILNILFSKDLLIKVVWNGTVYILIYKYKMLVFSSNKKAQ